MGGIGLTSQGGLKARRDIPESWLFDTVLDTLGPPRWLSGEEAACQAGDLSPVPWSGQSPAEGHGNPSSSLTWRIPRTEEPGG